MFTTKDGSVAIRKFILSGGAMAVSIGEEYMFFVSDPAELAGMGYVDAKESTLVAIEAAIRNWSLDAINEELGAAGHYSLHNDISEAREALVAMLTEYSIVRPIQVTIYWDRGDMENQGWAYRAKYLNDREESGSLRSNELHEAVDEACEILGMRGMEHEFSLAIVEGGLAEWKKR